MACSTNIIDNQLRVFLSDANQIGTEEKSGELAVVYLKAKEDVTPGKYILKFTDVVASDDKASRFVTPDTEIKVTVGNVPDAISAVPNDKAYVDVYTLQGTLVGRGMTYRDVKTVLGKGVYIVEGTKIIIR